MRNIPFAVRLLDLVIAGVGAHTQKVAVGKIRSKESDNVVQVVEGRVWSADERGDGIWRYSLVLAAWGM